jgi:catechol 2,3-dioxygenase-like lactoylglutathione lyase family enzyme
MEQLFGKLVQEFVDGKMTRRQLIQRLALTAAAVSAASRAAEVAAQGTAAPVTAVGFNHVSCQVADYGKTRDFYVGLLGMTAGNDNGKTEVELNFANNPTGGQFLPRHRPTTTPNGKVDHISYTIANWDSDPKVKAALEAELQRRGLKRIAGAGAAFVPGTYWEGPTGGHSFHLYDPDGLEIQLGGKIQ